MVVCGNGNPWPPVTGEGISGILGTLAIPFFVDQGTNPGVSREQETQPLDLTQQGEEGFRWETSM